MDDLQHELDDIGRRTRRYWFDDGLVEIFSAAVFFLVALYFAAQQALDHRLSVVPNLVFPILIVVLAFAGRGLVRVAKRRIVYPRTGYVAFQRPEGHRVATGALAFAIAVLTTLIITRAPLLLNWIPALEGLVFAFAFLSVGRKTGMLRFPIEGLVTAIVGLALSLQYLPENTAAALLFASVGAVTLCGGVIGLVGYLRKAPPREDS